MSRASDKLTSSGLSKDLAKELGMWAITDASKLDSAFHKVEALQLSYRDLDGSDTGFYRIRYLEDPPGFGAQLAKPQRYVQQKDTLNWVYLPHCTNNKGDKANWEALSKDSSRQLLITEGEFKAACAQIHGFDTIALGGVTMWQSSKRGVSLLPPLDKFNWRARSVVIVFDSDAAINPQVAKASVRLAKMLVLHGAIVRIASLPSAINGDKQGLDDFLVAGQDLDAVLAEAKPLEFGEYLAEFNDQYAYVKDQDVVIDFDTAHRYKRDSFVNGLHANTKVVEFQVLLNGGNKRIELSVPKEWLQWPARRDVSRLVFEPGRSRLTQEGNFNSWKSWGCVPSKGDVGPWNDLMEYVFSESPKDRRWFEQWCAAPIQRPGLKMYSGCLFWGPETGTGKSLIGVTIGRIYGHDNFTVVENADLFSQFNEWAVNKQFIMGDEISGTDKRHEADKLKSLITRGKVRINMKHLPTYEVTDCANYLFTSNHADGLFLEDKDRRWFIHRMPVKLKERAFYVKFMAWLDEKGGKEALMQYFLDLDLTGFDPGAPAPLTAAKLEMIDHAKSDVGAFVQDLQHNLEEGLEKIRQHWSLPEPPDVVLNKHLLTLYDPDEKTRVTSRGIGRALAASSVKSLLINRTAAFGTQRFYVLRNAEHWLTCQPEVVREYIDKIYKPTKPMKKGKY